MGRVGGGKVVVGKWRQLYLNNNKKNDLKKDIQFHFLSAFSPFYTVLILFSYRHSLPGGPQHLPSFFSNYQSEQQNTFRDHSHRLTLSHVPTPS